MSCGRQLFDHLMWLLWKTKKKEKEISALTPSFIIFTTNTCPINHIFYKSAPPVPDIHNHNNQFLIVYCINNAVASHPQPEITLSSPDLQRSDITFVRQSVNLSQNSLLFILWQSPDNFCAGFSRRT